jgi:hypothetical protein
VSKLVTAESRDFNPLSMKSGTRHLLRDGPVVISPFTAAGIEVLNLSWTARFALFAGDVTTLEFSVATARELPPQGAGIATAIAAHAATIVKKVAKVATRPFAEDSVF